MKPIRKISCFSLLVVAVLLVQNASAKPTEMLPESSHYQGRLYFDFYSISGRIDFAVYDTEKYPDEFVGADGYAGELSWWPPPPADNSRYIYAYQIFVDDDSIDVIDYFAILGLGDGAIVKDANTNDEWPISSVDDPSLEGVEPNSPYFVYSTAYGQMGVWEFISDSLSGGEHSWFLVLGSDHDWTTGSYTFDKTLADEGPIPNPEPATLMLLGLGSAVLFTRRRKFV